MSCYVHHEPTETTVRLDFVQGCTAASLLQQFRATAEGKTVPEPFALSRDGTAPLDDAAVIDALPKGGDLFVVAAKPRSLYIHVFKDKGATDPLEVIMRPYHPKLTRQEVLDLADTPATRQYVAGYTAVIKMTRVGAVKAIEWIGAKSTVGAFPRGGDIEVYPTSDRRKPPATATQVADASAPQAPTAVVTLLKQLEVAKKTQGPGRVLVLYRQLVKELPLANPAREGILAELAGLYLDQLKRPKDAASTLNLLLTSAVNLTPAKQFAYWAMLGKAQQAAGTHVDAVASFNEALSVMAAASLTVPKPDLRDVKVRLGRAMFDTNGADQGIGLVQDAMEGDTTYDYGLECMARFYSAKGHHTESIQWACNLLVRNQKSEVVKQLFGDIVAAAPDAVQVIRSDILKDSTPATASAWGFMAMAARDSGYLRQAERLYQQAVVSAPDDANHALNYAHSLEHLADTAGSVRFVHAFLSQHPALSVGGVRAGDVAALLDVTDAGLSFSLPDRYVRVADDDETVTLHDDAACNGREPESKHQVRLDGPEIGAGQTTYSEETGELPLLALYFTVVKALFVLGAMKTLPRLCHLINPARGKQHLHKTNIRNEQAYFTDVAMLLQYMGPVPVVDPCPLMAGGTDAQLFFLGDSHSLSPSWKTLRLGNRDRVIVNKLVTGLKCWHLRDEATFYPKRNFEAVTATLPPNADVVVCFGEIDCREGISVAVEKGYYDTEAEAHDRVIAVYVAKLLELKKRRSIRRLFVHSALPILDVTRHVVVEFNRRLMKAVAAHSELTPLDITDALLCPAEDTEATQPPAKIAVAAGEPRLLRREYAHDTTHVHPRYVESVLQPALSLVCP